MIERQCYIEAVSFQMKNQDPGKPVELVCDNRRLSIALLTGILNLLCPKKEVKRILDRSGRKELLPSRKVNGEVIKLFSFSDCFTTPKKETCLGKSDEK